MLKLKGKRPGRFLRQSASSRRNESVKRRCKICGTTFSPFHANDLRRGKFCSRECWTTWWSQRRPKAAQLKCFECGKTFLRAQSHAARRGDKRRFCSRACFAANNRTASNPLRRQHPELVRHHVNRKWIVASGAFRKRNPVCSSCGEKTTTVDHVVPFSFVRQYFPDANPDISANLAPLCRTCHGAKTQADRHLVRGDKLRFEAEMRRMGYPLELFHAAWQALAASVGKKRT